MAIFETHFHFEPDWNAETYYQEANDLGVSYFLAAGGDEKTTETAQKFASQFENAFFSAGVHPHDATKYEKDISMFANFAKKDDCVAIGEIGLDYFYENSEKKAQLTVFENFLNLAITTNLPAIVHCRDKNDSETAYEDAYSLLHDFQKSGGVFVVHCYTGSVSWAEKFLAIGAYLGITGIVTFPRAQNVRDVVKIIPNDKILLETDTPYLAPVPFRGKTNHSKYLPYIVTAVAKEKELSNHEVEKQTTENAFRLFKKAEK
jgi:TatD DNase family protein